MSGDGEAWKVTYRAGEPTSITLSLDDPAGDAEILDALSTVLPAELDKIIFELGVPVEMIPGAQATRAIEVIRYLESGSRLAEVVPLLRARHRRRR